MFLNSSYRTRGESNPGSKVQGYCVLAVHLAVSCGVCVSLQGDRVKTAISQKEQSWYLVGWRTDGLLGNFNMFLCLTHGLVLQPQWIVFLTGFFSLFVMQLHPKTKWPLMSTGKDKEVKESCKAKEAQRHEASPLEYTQTHMHTHKDSHTHAQT